MNILVSGHFDRNFGDDMMIRLAAAACPQHTFALPVVKAELLLPFRGTENIVRATDDMSYDAMLKIAGSGFQINGKVGILYALLRRLHGEGKLRHLPKAAIGCNIEPFENKLAARLAAHEIRALRVISTRDEASAAYFRKIAPRARVECHPDMLLGIPDAWLPPRTQPDCLGISVLRRIGDFENLPHYEALAACADDYIERTGKKVLLFAFDIENENDLSAAVTVRSLCHHRDRVEIIAHEDGGDTIMRGFARCETIIGMRFHSIVLALRMGIPCIPVLYAAKGENLLKDLHFSGSVFHVHTLTASALITAMEQGIPPYVLTEETVLAARRHTEIIGDDVL